MKDLQDIAYKWLKANGYDGLFLAGECGCFLEDIMPCGNPDMNCEAGYKSWGEYEGKECWVCGPEKTLKDTEGE